MGRVLAVLLAVVLAVGVTACAAPGRPASGSSLDPYAAIPLDGQHEKDAFAAVPSAMASVHEAVSGAGWQTPDLTGATPALFSYTLEAVAGDRVARFEVRADGSAHELDRYPALPDPSDLYWQLAAAGEGTDLPVPEGEREIAAAAAVRSIVGKAVPSGTVQVRMYGYTFCFVKDSRPVPAVGPATGQPFFITIDSHGNAASWSKS